MMRGLYQAGHANTGITIFEHQRFSPTSWLSEPRHAALVAAVGLDSNEQLAFYARARLSEETDS